LDQRFEININQKIAVVEKEISDLMFVVDLKGQVLVGLLEEKE